jgi:hypothetical protein
MSQDQSRPAIPIIACPHPQISAIFRRFLRPPSLPRPFAPVSSPDVAGLTPKTHSLKEIIMTIAVEYSGSVARIPADLTAVGLLSALGLVLTILAVRLGYGAAISQALALAG